MISLINYIIQHMNKDTAPMLKILLLQITNTLSIYRYSNKN